MSHMHSVEKSTPVEKHKGKNGGVEGKIYEKLSLALLAKNGYQLSKDPNSNITDFALGKEVGIGKDGKFDDIVFRYRDRNKTKNLIFVQIKHKQDDHEIDSKILSTEAAIAKDGCVRADDVGGRKMTTDYGNMAKDFNLQKYFISYLSVRDELKITKSQELRNGKMKHVVLFTTAGLNIHELKEKGFNLKKAPGDILKLFTLNVPVLNTESYNHCYQFISISKDLRKVLKKSSELNRLAIDIAMYVVPGKFREKIKGISGSIEHYHVPLAWEVIQISDQCQTEPGEKENSPDIPYREAQFRFDFIDNDEAGPKKELRDALFDIIRELDESKNHVTDDNLKNYLKDVRWKVVPRFGLNKQALELAREIASYVVPGKFSEKIMGIDGPIIKYYHVVLTWDVIQISDKIQTLPCQKQNSEVLRYREAWFRDCFIDNSGAVSKIEFRKTLFKEIRKRDNSKKSVTDEELRNHLKVVKWKVVPNFGEWMAIKEEDIEDFVKCLIFIVNQPKVNELDNLFSYSARDTVVENISLSQVVNKINNISPEFRKNVEQVLGIYQTSNNKEKWISGEKVLNFIEEQKQLIKVSFIASATSLIYEREILKHGEFKELRKLEICLDSFLSNSAQLLCINTSATLLSSVKVLQYLNSKKNFKTEVWLISINLDILRSNEMRESVSKAFESKSKYLLFIECRYLISKRDIEVFRHILSVMSKGNPKNKVIIVHTSDYGKFTQLEKHMSSFLKREQFVLENDFIDIRDFQPANDPFKKEVIIFQEEEKKTSLAALTGINCWDTYAQHLSQQGFENEQCGIDTQTIAEMLINDQIEIGSKPLGISSLEGAYATVYEEINKNTLINKLVLEEVDNNDIYIISGINGLNEEEKIDNFIHHLGFVDDQKSIKKQYGDTGSDSKLQIAGDEDFKRICCDHPQKRIYWIKYVEKVSKFFLQQFYNPKFYVERKFKNIVIANSIKLLLINENLSEIFIFYSANNLQQLNDTFHFDNKCDEEQYERNCLNGKVNFFNSETDAEKSFQEKCKQNSTVHLFKFEEQLIVWCNSHGTLSNLREYISYENSETSLIEEETFVKHFKDRKVLIIADDPGMGKSTTLTKLYESKYQSESFTETHWVFRINLKNHLQAVKDLELYDGDSDIVNAINFLSKVDLKLNNKLAENILRVIFLDKMKKIRKPLLFAFDGFDEILDIIDRKKIISLLRFLNDKTSAKIWITTRRHYQEILEQEFSTFAIQLHPMNDDAKVAYIKKYLEHYCYLILSEKQFAELFIPNTEMPKHDLLHRYTTDFLNKMKSVFSDNVLNFIGTPLQLYLMLEGSVRHFKDWSENPGDQNPNFDYLGADALEVYEKFIDRKYGVYFEKMGIEGSIRQEQDKFIFNEFSKDFVESSILKSKPKDSLKMFKDIVLLGGIIQSHGSNDEFIHATFRDYFAAKMFSQWIREAPNGLPYSSKQEYLIKVIFLKPDYQPIRAFINMEMKKISETESFEKIFENYEKIFEKLFREEQSLLLDENGTVLHHAIVEGNKFIVSFFLNCLKGLILTKFLFHNVGVRPTVLFYDFSDNDAEIVRMLLDAAERISKDTLEDLLHSRDRNGRSALGVAVRLSKNIEILKELLNRAENKLNLILNENEKCSLLNEAIVHKQNEFVMFIFQIFKHDENSAQKLLLFCDDDRFNALCLALLHENTIAEHIIFIAREMKYGKETLKKMLIPGNCEKEPLRIAIKTGEVHFVEMILNVAKDVNDDNQILKQLLLSEGTQQMFQYVVTNVDYTDILKLLLKTVTNVSVEILKKLVFSVNKGGKSIINLMIEYDLDDTLVYLQKILEEDEQNENKKILVETILQERKLYDAKKRFISLIEHNKIYEVRKILHEAKKSDTDPKRKLRDLLLAVDTIFNLHNTLHVACSFGYADILKELLSYAISVNDGGMTLNDLINGRNYLGETPFDILKNGYTEEIAQIVNALIGEKSKENKKITKILNKIHKKYTRR